MMEILNKIRSDYESEVVFLAVDLDTPTGQSFSQGQRVNAIDLVIFDRNGERQKVLNGAIDEQGLRSALNDTLNPS